MESIVVYLFLLLFFTIFVVLKLLLVVIRYFDIQFNGSQLLLDYQPFMELTALSFLWYSISLSFTLYNKWILQQWTGGFNFPIIITTAHMVVKAIATRIWGCSNNSIRELPWKTYATIAIPIGALTAADIVFSNAAIMFLPLSLYTTIKGSALIFTYIWGVICKVEKFDWAIFSAVTTICVGIGIAVSTTVDVNFLGVFLALSSAACGGLRWVLLQVMVEVDERSLKSPMTALYHFAPPSAVSIIPFALLFEGPRLMRSQYATSEMISGETMLLITLGGMISLVLIVVEVVLLQLTSSLTLSVIGQVKEILQIVLAMFLFDESIQLKSAVGIALSIFGSYCYKQLHVSNVHGNITQNSATSVEEADEYVDNDESGSTKPSTFQPSGIEMVDIGMMKPMQIQGTIE